MPPWKRHSLVGISLLALVLAWGCGDGGGGGGNGPLGPPGTLVWAKRAGGACPDVGRDVAVLSDDSFVVVGQFDCDPVFGEGEASETMLTSAGAPDIFVARYRADGSLVWAKRAGGAGEDVAYGVAALSDNSVVVAGNFEQTAVFAEGEPGEISLTSAGGPDIFVARYTSDGSLLWAKRAGAPGGGSEIPWGAAALSDGSAVVTGAFEGTVTFGQGETSETVLTSAGSIDMFAARYGPDGSLVWAKQAGGTGIDDGLGVCRVQGDATVVTGRFSVGATFGQGESKETTLTPAGSRDVFLARYDADGLLVWVSQAGGTGYDGGGGVGALSDGSVAVTGLFSDVATFGQGEPGETALSSVGSIDVFVARYSVDGSLVWARRAGGASVEAGSGVAALSDGSLAVAGWFEQTATFGQDEPNETSLTSAGQADIFVARYGTGGSVVWAARAGGTGGSIYTYESAYHVAILSDDSMIATGAFEDAATFGEGEPNEATLTSAGNTDIFIARYAP